MSSSTDAGHVHPLVGGEGPDQVGDVRLKVITSHTDKFRKIVLELLCYLLFFMIREQTVYYREIDFNN